MNISKKQLIITDFFTLLFVLGVCFYLPSKRVEAKGRGDFAEVTVIKNEEKLDTLLEEHKVVVLFVHMKRCVPCKRLSPKFSQLARENERGGVVFVKIDREDASKLCEQYSIKMFPTVLIFKEGSVKNNLKGVLKVQSNFLQAR